jgi:hypothetical protein
MLYIFARQQLFCFGNKVSCQIVGIPMGTNWAPLIAGLFYDKSWMREGLDINIRRAQEVFIRLLRKYVDIVMWSANFMKFVILSM